MARYPTFEEYAKTGKHVDGIKRCNDLLKKSPKDSQLLIVKLQLLCAIGQDHTEALDQLLAIKPVITNLGELCTIEAAIIESLQDVYPPVITTGPSVNKLWDNAFKALLSPRDKLDLLTVRFNRAVMDNRLQDAQQILIAVKVFQPKNRAMYMAHAAYTQLLSTSKEDLQSRLALSLARKAVAERFDDEKGLDCRVPGQIFAHQNSEKDLEEIRERSFRESKQVYHALKLSEPALSNGAPALSTSVDPNDTSSREWLLAEVEKLKHDFTKIIDAGAPLEVLKPFIANTIRLFHTSITSLDLGGRDRGAADVCFLAISGLVKLWSATSNDTACLLQASYLAERLLKHNEHIHEARLILVYLYMTLGLGSLAMRLFDSLSIKEVQYDTVGHTLFSQISLTHPFKVYTAKSDFDPHERSHRGLGVYSRHDEKLADCESAVLDHGQTGMIFDLQELRSALRDSLTRRMLVLEHRRICRLTGKARAKNANNIGPKKLANWTNVKDNRDFSAAFDFGFNVERALYDTSSNNTDILQNLAADTAWSLASKQDALILDIDELITHPNPSSNNLTIPLIRILHALSTSGISPTASSFQTLIDSLTTLKLPPSATITQTYQNLDHLRIILQSCRYIKDTATNIPIEVKELQDLARKLVKDNQSYAKSLATAVKPGPVVEQLAQYDFLVPFDQEGFTDFAETLVASAKEGWEGVGKITIPGL